MFGLNMNFKMTRCSSSKLTFITLKSQSFVFTLDMNLQRICSGCGKLTFGAGIPHSIMTEITTLIIYIYIDEFPQTKNQTNKFPAI